MGRDVGRHANGDARGAVDQQIGNAGRQRQRLLLLAVVIRHEIDRFHVDVGQQLGADALETAFGVAVGGGRIAIDGAEIALAVDQRVAHREILRHAHEGFVGRGVAVRVVFAEHVTHHPRTLHVWPVRHVVRFVHGEEDTAVHRLQSVANVRQRTPHDDAHGVIEVRTAHLFFEAYRQRFFGDLVHAARERGETALRARKKGMILACGDGAFRPDAPPRLVLLRSRPFSRTPYARQRVLLRPLQSASAPSGSTYRRDALDDARSPTIIVLKGSGRQRAARHFRSEVRGWVGRESGFAAWLPAPDEGPSHGGRNLTSERGVWKRVHLVKRSNSGKRFFLATLA